MSIRVSNKFALGPFSLQLSHTHGARYSVTESISIKNYNVSILHE